MQLEAIVFYGGLICALTLLFSALRRPRWLNRVKLWLAVATLALCGSGLLLILLHQQPAGLRGLLQEANVALNPLDVLLRQLASGSIHLVIQTLERNPAMLAQAITWLIALVLILGGLTVWLLARRRTGRWVLNNSSGPLLVVVGLLLFMLPAMARGAVDTLREAETPVVAETTSAQPDNLTLAATNTPWPTMIAAQPTSVTQQSTRVALVLTPLPTRYVYSSPEPAATPEVSAVCQGVTVNNLNLREEPGTDHALVTTIPHSSRIDIHAENADASWLWVSYGTQQGWVSSNYVDVGANCTGLPQRTS